MLRICERSQRICLHGSPTTLSQSLSVLFSSLSSPPSSRDLWRIRKKENQAAAVTAAPARCRARAIKNDRQTFPVAFLKVLEDSKETSFKKVFERVGAMPRHCSGSARLKIIIIRSGKPGRFFAAALYRFNTVIVKTLLKLHSVNAGFIIIAYNWIITRMQEAVFAPRVLLLRKGGRKMGKRNYRISTKRSKFRKPNRLVWKSYCYKCNYMWYIIKWWNNQT